jgi:hypothetical protein
LRGQALDETSPRAKKWLTGVFADQLVIWSRTVGAIPLRSRLPSVRQPLHCFAKATIFGNPRAKNDFFILEYHGRESQGIATDRINVSFGYGPGGECFLAVGIAFRSRFF